MRRSVIFTNLLHLSPEFKKLETLPRDLAGAVVSDAMDAIPATHRDQFAATREFLATITPGDRSAGWLERYAVESYERRKANR